ncbi:sugar porter family MFS transporter [Streptomyces sp. CRN 30]|uniref:sugar porter family MFS transporter n=1 Tax=Streptomyces sp. CRN 30 TaxID=3075613 RepID=UPI002A81D2A5|nr:sugar porter family MFS transporter [Streptomyces sp. CRN 30]
MSSEPTGPAPSRADGGTEKKTDDRSIRRRQNRVAGIATLGGFLFGYDTGVISGALIYISSDLNLSSTEQSVVVSCLLAGAAVGGTFGGRVSDTLGRRAVIHWASVLFLLGTVGSVLAVDMAMMVAARVVLGLGVGAVSAVVPLYIGEIAPSERRGRLVNQNEVMIVTGQLAAAVVNAVIAAVTDSDEVWRWMLAVALVPAVGLFVGCRFLPDSPRWLIGHDRAEEASRVLRELRDPRTADEEYGHIKDIFDAHRHDTRVEPRRYLTVRWVRVLVLLGVGVSLCQQLAGVNAVVYYAPTVLADSGLGTDASITSDIAIGGMGVAATLIGMYLVGRVDRRPMLMTGQLGVAASHLLVVVLFTVVSGTVMSVSVLVAMVVFVFFQQCFISTVTWLVLSELFPMRVRGFAMGISVFFQWTANLIVSLAFPNVIDAFGPQAAFGSFVVLSLLGFTFTRWLLPETRGESLEDLERRLKARYS